MFKALNIMAKHQRKMIQHPPLISNNERAAYNVKPPSMMFKALCIKVQAMCMLVKQHHTMLIA